MFIVCNFLFFVFPMAISKLGYTALMYAVVSKNIDIVKRLLGHKELDVDHHNKAGLTAMKIASKQQDKEIMKLLEEFEPIPPPKLISKNDLPV